MFLRLFLLLFLCFSCTVQENAAVDADNADIIFSVESNIAEINGNCYIIYIPKQIIRGEIHPNLLDSHGAIKIMRISVSCNRNKIYAGEVYNMYLKKHNDTYKVQEIQLINESFSYSLISTLESN